MLFVACSGFPVPVSRYWDLFPSVEISETRLGIPGSGTIRRWLRESPDDFAFTAVAPKELGESGFKKTKENKDLVDAFATFAEKLGAQAVVFEAPEGFELNKANKSALKAFVSWLPDGLPSVVVDVPGWPPADTAKLLAKASVTVAYDPIHDTPPPPGDLVYARLPGPAGHRSRYDEESIDTLFEHCQSIEAETAFCVFCNIDMQANASALLQKLAE